jgi:hypothetical protein
VSPPLIAEQHFDQAIRYLRQAAAIRGYTLCVYFQQYASTPVLHVLNANILPDILKTMGDSSLEILKRDVLCVSVWQCWWRQYIIFELWSWRLGNRAGFRFWDIGRFHIFDFSHIDSISALKRIKTFWIM